MPKVATTTNYTVKERKFIEGKLRGLGHTQAAIEAGYSKRTARNIGTDLMAKPRIQAGINRRLERMGDVLQEMGITAQIIVEPVLLALKATKQEKRVETTIDEAGDTHETVKWLDVPDVNMRLRGSAIAWRMLADVKKMEDDERNPFNSVNLTLNANVQKLGSLDEVELQKMVFENSSGE